MPDFPEIVKPHRQKDKKPLEPPANAKVVAQFQTADGEAVGPSLNLPIDATPEQLQLVLNRILQNEEQLPYAFTVDGREIIGDLFQDVMVGKSQEQRISIAYKPQAVFRVRQVTRCSATLTGHTEAVLVVSFSPDGSKLATGSGDKTVRLWDLPTETPSHTLTGHRDWVNTLQWSPDSRRLCSGSMDCTLRLWDPIKGVSMGDGLVSHSKCITAIAFEPMHRNRLCSRMASSSKDCTVKIWDTTHRKVLQTLSQHTAPVMCVRWGGEGLLYTASRDKSIKVWDTTTFTLVRSLDGHAHWVNHLALSTDFILRTGPYDHTDPVFNSPEEAFEAAQRRYSAFVAQNGPERLASCSDDFTLFLWQPQTTKKPIARMTGHQQLVNHLCFSPDGSCIASASFDKSVKLWDGTTGSFLATLRGHVGAIYQVCWSSDSRQVLSASRDTTLKVWDARSRKMKMELPGHEDEVFAVDWSPGGDRVASGGKDKSLKLWKH